MSTQRGFQLSEIKHGDYILGGAYALKGEVLMPTGHGWADYLPPREDQSRDGFETYACVSFAITHAVETLIRKKFQKNADLSARFLAFATGTKQKQGNDPTTVCIFLGKKGDVNDRDWPYPTPATDFYNPPPQNLYTLALEFPLEYEYDNQWVPSTPEAMKDALTRSPLTVAGYAWAERNNLYYWPDGAQSDHYFVVYDYVDGVKWLAFDTYSNEYKELEWGYPFVQIKEHSLTNQVVVPSFFDKFIQLLRQILGLDGESFGAVRSPQFAKLSKDMIKEAGGLCQFGMHKPTLLNPLNTHHCIAFHNDPSQELVKENLIVVCRFHHYSHAHFFNWKDSNPNVREDAKAFTDDVNNHRKQ